MSSILVLVANPLDKALDSKLVEMIQHETRGDINWLHQRIACEIHDPRSADAVAIARQVIGTKPVDAGLVSVENRRKKLLVADMDSTMIEQECIDELAAEAGVGAHVAAITARAMNGELDFEDALRARVALLRGLPEAVIARVIRDRITLMPGGQALVATMRANGAYAALVSGGFTAFTASIEQVLGFDENRANTLLLQDGKLTGQVAEPILGRAAKVQALTDISAMLQITPQDAMAVGDGANDLGMLGLAGAGVALHAKPSVAAQCDIRINHGDLTALLYLQGYSRAEFVA